MSTVFIGGSRGISRLPVEVLARLDNVVGNGHGVVVGDAAGIDKAVQHFLRDRSYAHVRVFCSGARPRNNLGEWPIHRVETASGLKGFQFQAAKDREMAREADFGLMIWDGRSPGTILNVLRLASAGKYAVLFDTKRRDVINIKSADAIRDFILRCDADVRKDMRARATQTEWQSVFDRPQSNLLAGLEGGVAP